MASISFLIAGLSLLSGYLKSGLTDPIVCILGIFSTFGFLLHQTSMWLFIMQNWIVGREVPKLLQINGFIDGYFVATDKKIGENGYQIIRWLIFTIESATGLIFVFFFTIH